MILRVIRGDGSNVTDANTIQTDQTAQHTGAEHLAQCVSLADAGQFTEALTELSRLLLDARAADDLALSASTLYQTAWCCMRLGKTDAGLECAAEARRQWVRVGNVGETARTMALESLLLLDAGMSDDGYEEAEQAIAAAEMAGDPDVLGFARNVKACILAVCGQPHLAQPLLEKAIAAVAESGDLQAHAFYHLNLGFVLYKHFEMAEHAGQVHEAIRHLDTAVSVSEQAIQLAFEHGDTWTLRSAIANAAELNARAGHLVKARELLVQWDEVPGDPGASARIHYLYTLGDILLRQSELTEALAVCEKALALATANNQVDHLVNVTRKLADIHSALGDHAEAFDLHRKFHALHVKQSGETARRRANTSAVRLQTAEWRQKATRFADQAMKDPLTQIANRRAFDQKLAGLAGQTLALGIVDLDHFKQVNDTHTHVIGDEVLKRVAQMLAEHCGKDGLVARLGGEEFGLIFPDTQLSQAIENVTRLRKDLSETDWSDIADPLEITISVGLAAGDSTSDTAVLMALADARLYTAKHRGRDQIVSDDAALDVTRAEPDANFSASG